MKRVFVLCLLSSSIVFAQDSHSAALTWTAGRDKVDGYSVYRAAGACPSSSVPGNLAKLADVTALDQNTGAVLTHYADTAVTAGAAYCYTVRAFVNSAGFVVESLDSNTAGAQIPLAPPAGLTANGH